MLFWIVGFKLCADMTPEFTNGFPLESSQKKRRSSISGRSPNTPHRQVDEENSQSMKVSVLHGDDPSENKSDTEVSTASKASMLWIDDEYDYTSGTYT